MTQEDKLCPKEIAQVLNCDVRFVYSEIKAKRLAPAVRINRKTIWVMRSTVLRYLRAKTLA